MISRWVGMYVCMYGGSNLDIYRGFRKCIHTLCMLTRICSIFTVVSETYKLIWGVKKLLHRNVCMYVWPFSIKNPAGFSLKCHKHPYIHFDVTTSFWCLFDGFLKNDGKYRRNWNVCMTKTCLFGPETMVNIDEILFFQASKVRIDYSLSRYVCYRGFRTCTLFCVCKSRFARCLSTFLKHTN